MGGVVINYYKIGDKGEMIRKIQTLLNKIGYSLTVDGIYGSKTQEAVMDFQRANHIISDGTVGPDTLETLLLKNGFSKTEAYINSRDFYSKTNYVIYTNVTEHYVYIFKGKNKNWQLLKKFLATVGKPSTPTLKGRFTVKAKGPGYSKPDFKVKWYTQYHGNYLFHSILFNHDGSIYDGRLGMDLSDGCIRLKEEAAKFIYDHIPYGSSVIIE